MKSSELKAAISELGVDAVLRYCAISHSENESSIPEIFLGGFIASRLYERVRHPIHIERLYTRMAKELGIPISPELIELMGGQRADMAIYDGKAPSHIVEFKIFDERTQAVQIAADLEKAKKLSSLKPISIILGALICETTRGKWDQRVQQLRDALGSTIEPGKQQKSIGGSWYWSFGCFYLEAA